MSDEQQMIEAIKAGNADKVRDLIEKDIFLADAKADDGTSALLTAIYHREEEIIDIILESGPTLTIHEAAAAGIDDRVAELIRENKGNIDSYSHDGWTPLHLAVFFNQNQIAEMLIEQGANVDAVSKNQQGVTPLHSALANRNVKIAKLLLHRGADPSVTSAAGYTPMHYVATYDLVEIGRILLDRKVDLDAKNADGRTPLDIAREKGSERAVRMLTGDE